MLIPRCRRWLGSSNWRPNTPRFDIMSAAGGFGPAGRGRNASARQVSRADVLRMAMVMIHGGTMGGPWGTTIRNCPFWGSASTA